MQYHEVANLFPLLPPEQLQELATDIAAHGLVHPIIVHEGKILDGRNRYQACLLANIPPRFEPFIGTSPLHFIISTNLHRRHLTSSQRATIALDVETILTEQAKERMKAGGGKKSAGSQLIDYPVENRGRAAEHAAEMMGTNRQYVSDAKRIKTDAPPLFARVQAGELSIPEAKRLMEVPHVAHNTGNNEWYTPHEYITRAVMVMGAIDLDPASTEIANTVIGAARFYTVDDNGLTKPWAGRLFLNPPYASELISEFVNKLLVSSNVTEAIVLVNNATETKWFQSLAQKAHAVCFPAGRVKFWHPERESAPLQGQAVLYLGPNVKKFSEQFADIGTLWHKTPSQNNSASA